MTATATTASIAPAYFCAWLRQDTVVAAIAPEGDRLPVTRLHAKADSTGRVRTVYLYGAGWSKVYGDRDLAGMDPESKRSLWSLLQAAGYRKGMRTFGWVGPRMADCPAEAPAPAEEEGTHFDYQIEQSDEGTVVHVTLGEEDRVVCHVEVDARDTGVTVRLTDEDDDSHRLDPATLSESGRSRLRDMLRRLGCSMRGVTSWEWGWCDEEEEEEGPARKPRFAGMATAEMFALGV